MQTILLKNKYSKMKKIFFKWMMAIAIVATPMAFVSCGDDDNETGSTESGQTEGKYAYFLQRTTNISSQVDIQQFNQAIQAISTEFYKAIYTALGQNFVDGVSPSVETLADTIKVRLECDAVYERLKDTDLYGGSLVVTVFVGTSIDDSQSVASYKFGRTTTTQHISFENASLNNDLYWIGDSVNGKKGMGDYGPIWACTYTEGLATVNTTYADGWWSGFAISACTGTEFNDGYAGTDQYNNITGEAYKGNNFLVINGMTPSGNNITFSQPVTIVGFSYTNAAVTVNSILNGDFMEQPFTTDDWLKCIVTGTRQNGESVTYDITLAAEGNYVNSWKTASGMNKDFTNIVKLEFSFDGTRKSQGGLNTPAYMCLDYLVLK